MSSLVVLDGDGTGRLQIIRVTDAAGATAALGAAPAGGVDTGGGALAGDGTPADAAGAGGALLATSAGLLAVLLAVGTTGRLRRRRAA